MKTANLAIVFTDIKGFTERTSRQTLEENQRLLHVHEALLVPLFKAFGGRIIKSIGDAFLVTFESPTQAVLSGIAIQDRLWQHNRNLVEDEQLHVRVAVNVGEVRLEANDIFGEPVNIAARVEGITEADEVFFTEAVYLSMNKAEVPSQEVGSFELKGIPGKIRVFRVPRAPYRVEAPAPGAVVLPQDESSQPPFGNLALARVVDPGMDLGAFGQRAAAGAAQFGQGAAQLGQRAAGGAAVLGQRASVLGRQARTAGGALWSRVSQSLPEGMGSRLALSPARGKRLAAVGVLALVLGVGVVAWGGGAAQRAIRAVEGTTGAEKAARVSEAKRLIREEEDAGRRLFLTGRLEEAQGDVDEALGAYAHAVRKGSDDAASRIVSLLGHEQCAVRSAAADTAGSLRLEAARGELEDLAEDGGKDDDKESGGLFSFGSCDSKKAAASALKRLPAK